FAHDELLLDGLLPRRFENEGVRARVDRESGAVQAVGEHFAIHRDLDLAEILAVLVLGLEDDAGDGVAHLLHALQGFLAYGTRTARRGTDQETATFRAKLVLVA